MGNAFSQQAGQANARINAQPTAWYEYGIFIPLSRYPNPQNWFWLSIFIFGLVMYAIALISSSTALILLAVNFQRTTPVSHDNPRNAG